MMGLGWALFDVLVGSVFAFAGAALVAFVARWAFGLRRGRLRIAVLMLPVAKVLADAARGIPSDAFCWARLAHVKRDIGLFWLNVQVRAPLVPVLRFAVGARAAGRVYPDSAAAILAGYLGRVAAPWVPAMVGGALAGVGVVRLALAARGALARTPRRAAVMRGARVVERRALGPWSVPVVVSASRGGVPFAAGFLRPYVCFPAAAYDALSPAERDAVVHHELAHHRAGDLFVLALVGAARAFFWFLPGLGWLAREVRSQCELCADASAVARGAEPHALASALVRVAELALPSADAAPALAFGKSDPVIARRVRQLLGDARSSSRLVSLARAAGLVMFALGALRATTLGYH